MRCGSRLKHRPVDPTLHRVHPLARNRAGDPVGEAGALAVLPFDNISSDPETDYFSDGLTEELIARLSLVSEIDLVSRWASMQFKGRQKDVGAIGTELGARYVVGGSVRRFQESVRITVQASGLTIIETRAKSRRGAFVDVGAKVTPLGVITRL